MKGKKVFTMPVIKPYSEIPGPKAYPIIGALYNYLGRSKKYDFTRLHRNGISKYDEYGPIVKEKFPFGRDVVWLFDPKDVKTMFDCEGKYPLRRSHLALEHYRMKRPNIYKNGGLLPTNGPEWWHLRQPAFLPFKLSSSEFTPGMDQISKEFVGMVGGEKEDEFENFDFLEDLKKFFLEVAGFFTLDVRFGAIKKDLPEESTPSRLIDAAFSTNSNILSTDNGLMLWKLFETEDYKAIKESQEFIEKTIQEYFTCVSKNEDMGKGLLSQWLKSDDLDPKDSLGLAADMILAGIDTSSYTTGFLFYEISKHEEIQEKLYNEINASSSIQEWIKKRNSYGRRVLKESLRLHPVSVGVSRILDRDAVLSGYQVPKGTLLVSQNQVSCRLSQFFPSENPNEFNPAHWDREVEGQNAQLHPYLLLPFGHGKRGCIGRRMAEQSILILMFRFFQIYKIEWIGTQQLDCISHLINKPDNHLAFNIKRR